MQITQEDLSNFLKMAYKPIKDYMEKSNISNYPKCCDFTCYVSKMLLESYYRADTQVHQCDVFIDDEFKCKHYIIHAGDSIYDLSAYQFGIDEVIEIKIGEKSNRLLEKYGYYHAMYRNICQPFGYGVIRDAKYSIKDIQIAARIVIDGLC